jgi:hypothetical protein
MDAEAAPAVNRKVTTMRRIVMAGLLAVALIAVFNRDANAGAVIVNDSHQLKAEVVTARIRLYEHEMTLRALNPTAFDQKFPVLGKLLANEQSYDAFLSDHRFAKLLCVHTPFLWRVVAGDIFYHRLHPWSATEGSQGLHGDGLTGGPPPSGPGPDGRNAGGSGGSLQANGVPEPSSWVLTASALGLALLALIRRRIYQFAMARKRREATACTDPG